MAKCPNINDGEARFEFNEIVTLFDGKPLTNSEFRNEGERALREGNDKVAMDMAYKVWDTFDGVDIPLDKEILIESIAGVDRIVNEIIGKEPLTLSNLTEDYGEVDSEDPNYPLFDKLVSKVEESGTVLEYTNDTTLLTDEDRAEGTAGFIEVIENDKIRLFLDKTVSKEEFRLTATHEMLHVITVAALLNPKTEEEQIFKERIDEVYEHVKGLLEDRNLMESYGLDTVVIESVDEFLSYALTEGVFRDFLNGIKFNSKKSVWEGILDYISGLLNISVNKGSALHAILNTTSDYLYTNKLENNNARLRKILEGEARYRQTNNRSQDDIDDDDFFNGLNDNVNAAFDTVEDYEGSLIENEELIDDDIMFFDDHVSTDVFESSYFGGEDTDGNIDPISDAILTKAINELKVRKNSLYNSISKNPETKESVMVRIEEIKENIEKLKKSALVKNVIDIAEKSISNIEGVLTSNKRVTVTDVKQASEEISALRSMVSQVLEVKGINKSSGKPIYRLEDSPRTDEAERIEAKLNELDNTLLNLTRTVISDLAKDKNGDPIPLKDLTEIKDVGLLWSAVMDSSRVDNKLVSYLSGVLKDTNRNIMAEFEETIGIQLTKILEETGFDKNGKDFNERVLQKDADGNITKNLVDVFSQSYYDWKSKQRVELGQLNRVKDARKKNQKKKAYQDFMDNIYLPNYNILFGNDNEDARNEEIAKIKDLLGEVVGERLVSSMEKKITSYNKSKVAVVETFQRYHDAGRVGFKTIAEYKGKIAEWESYNNPMQLYEELTSNNVETTNFTSVTRFLSYAPKSEVNGQKSEWYDKDYEFIQNNPETYGKLYNFITENINNLKDYFPPHVAYALQHNHLPQVNKDILEKVRDEGIAGVITGKSLLDRVYGGLSEEQDDLDSQLRDSNGKPIKSVPIKFTKDTVGKLRVALSKAEKDYIRQESVFNGHITSKGATEASIKIQKDILDVVKGTRDSIKSDYDREFNSKSSDVIKAFKMFSFSAINYKRKSAVEDILTIGKEMVEKSIEIEKSKSNSIIRNKIGKGEKLNVVRQLEYEIDNILYNKGHNKGGILSTKVGLTKEARKTLKALKKEKNELELDMMHGRVEKEDYEERKLSIQARKDAVQDTGFVSPVKAFDKALKLTFFTSLGWNASSALTNTLYGYISNSVEAASGRYFTKQELNRAMGVLKHSMKRSATGRVDDVSTKVRSLMAKYGIMFDLLEDASGSSKIKEHNKKLGLAAPMELTKRAEYLNQAAVLVANLMHTKVQTVDGTEVSLWESYDNHANMSEEVLDSEQWDTMYDATKSNSFTKKRNNLIQLIKRVHGNYDPSSPMQAKKYLIGRATLALKSWIAEGIATRIETYKEDDQMGDPVKGRYRTYKDLGFANSVKIMKSILLKNLAVGEEFNADNKEMQTDLDNMRRNLKEIQWFLMMSAAMLIANLAFDDEDEKAEGYRLAYKTVSRLQDDVSLYMNPKALMDMFKNPSPLLRTIDNVVNIPSVVTKYATSDDARHDETYLIKGTFRAIPGLAMFQRWL